MANPQVQILLSTYNGARYLAAQLDSVVAQTERDWQLLIRDDGSTDETLKIISSYISRHPDKIILVTDGQGGSSSMSFMSLLSQATAPYIMFCDQDDVWLPAKVADTLAALKRLEAQHPIALVFTDMQVVDEELNPLAASFFEAQKINPAWTQEPYAALVQSCAAGCTMMFTRALSTKLHPISAALFQHDHWLQLHAAFYGRIDFVSAPTVLYRQHDANVLGAHAVDRRYFASKLKSLGDVFKRWQYLRSVLGSELSYLKLMAAKWKLNRQRL